VRGGRRVAAQRLSLQAREALSEADKASAEGRWAEAGALLHRQGLVARQRQLPAIAAWLFVRAAVAHVRAGDRLAMVASAEEGLKDAAVEGNHGRSARAFGALEAAVGECTFADAAQALHDAVRVALGVAPKVPGPGRELNRNQVRGLPAACEVCETATVAAALRSTEEGHVVCPTCGTPLL
jgi:hypothetical protein